MAQFEYRILVIPDDSPYDAGDGTPEQIAEAEQAASDYGVWGWCVERRDTSTPVKCDHCGHTTSHDWEHVDSCFGYVGTPSESKYMLSEATDCLPVGLRDVPVYSTSESGYVRQGQNADRFVDSTRKRPRK